jgi:hypothetical protein
VKERERAREEEGEKSKPAPEGPLVDVRKDRARAAAGRRLPTRRGRAPSGMNIYSFYLSFPLLPRLVSHAISNILYIYMLFIYEFN